MEEKEKILFFPSERLSKPIKYFKKKCCFPIILVPSRLIVLSILFCFYVLEYKLKTEKGLFDLNKFNSPRLLNKQNIHQIHDLNISVNIECSKYVHLKITDKNKKRWEIPKEILNPEYFNNLNNIQNTKEDKTLFKMNVFGDKDNFYGNNFGFDLSVKNNENDKKNIFYSFKMEENFLFSDNFISFESYLTSDNIYGFGERIHEFKLDGGVYTIWPVDRYNFEEDGKGSKNLYGHQPIGLHKTKFNNIWIGFVFLNSNAQDVEIYKRGSEQKIYLSHKTIGGIIDYYIIVDNSPENVVKDIHFLLGNPILPPYWALGIHQCRWGFKNTSEFENVYDNYIEKKYL